MFKEVRIRKIYGAKCKKYKKVIKPKILYISYISLPISSICNKCRSRSEDEKIFIEEESFEILQIIGLINYIEYQKIYNYASKNIYQ